MLNFEKYLSDFNSTIDLQDFLVNFFVVAILAFLIKEFYGRFGRALSDRRKFAGIFLPLALATLLIITVIKSSIALSLGLVGALSIVRFRAAIKDPEELTYLFLVIGLGIVGGANKPLLAVLSFALILPILYLHSRMINNEKTLSGKAHINIRTSHGNVQTLIDAISNGDHLSYLELKRVDAKGDRHFYSLVGKLKSVSEIEGLKDAILSLDSQADISIIDQPDIIL